MVAVDILNALAQAAVAVDMVAMQRRGAGSLHWKIIIKKIPSGSDGIFFVYQHCLPAESNYSDPVVI
jgi:hypothetical protein